MQLDVDDLREFYATPLGQTVRRLLTHRIRARWRGLHRSTLIGLGYSSPYLGAFRGEALHLGALMPDSQGAVRWPRDAPSQTALVDDDRLPLADGSVDRLLAVHCLEVADSTRQLLREMWRVLAPEGRMILVVPNRRGVWARLDNTPFGHGRPYSRRQLDQLLTGGHVHAARLGRRAVLSAARPPNPAALVDRLGARRCRALARLLRRIDRRGEQGADGPHWASGKGASPAAARAVGEPDAPDAPLAGFAEALRRLQID